MTAPNPDRFINRELSWLEFNHRVLEEARDGGNPLLERLKFFCIVSSNLDEFFEVRVAGIKQQIESRSAERTPDGLTPEETLAAVTARARRLVREQYECWRQSIEPELGRNGVGFLRPEALSAKDAQWIERYYRAEVRPTLTPLGIDPAHPFPQLLNKSLNLIVRLDTGGEGAVEHRTAVVQVPRVLPRLVQLPRTDGTHEYVFLGQLIGHFLADLFAGTRIRGYWPFRVTRNSELYIDEEESANLLAAVEQELHNRRRGDAVRLEVEDGCPPEVRQQLLATLRLGEGDLYSIDGPLSPGGLLRILDGRHPPELRDKPFLPPVVKGLRDSTDIFSAVRKGDVLMHHPYESFESVVAFLQQAATDAGVLAIKITLYRTGGDARIIGALMDAARAGKQVTAVVELRARFDEANNIQWARRLEDAGVHVLYGLVGYKIHCKICLVVRRDPDGIRRYVHLSTGNYNATTARIYTDLGLFTAHPELGEDATNLFNVLTGICQFPGMSRFLVAPFELHKRMVALVRRETANARAGLPARIVAKMNSLVDTEIIDALYEASQAGVKVELIVRGVCCLRPGVAGLSENITVRSIVGRFLEHSRIFYFENGCRPDMYLGSADWMPRNFFRRIEVVFPVLDGNLRERLMEEILEAALADNTKARALGPDGRFTRRAISAKTDPRHCQAEFMSLALKSAPAAPNSPRTRGHLTKVKVRSRPS